MTSSLGVPRRNHEILFLRLLGLLLATAISAAAPVARAQAPSGGETIGGILDSLNLRTQPATPPDFVLKSRPDRNSLDYSPLSAPEPGSADKKRTPAELDAIGANLAGAAAQNQRKAARVKIPETGAPAPHEKRSRSPSKNQPPARWN